LPSNQRKVVYAAVGKVVLLKSLYRCVISGMA